MKNNNKALLACTLMAVFLLAHPAANAAKCETKKEEPKERTKTCFGLNTKFEAEDNPWYYVNADVECDMGLELPGLPVFGFDGSLDMCEVAKSATKDVVDQLNKTMEDGMTDLLSEVGLTMDNQLKLDLNDIADNELQKWKEKEALKAAKENLKRKTETAYINELGQDIRLRGSHDCGQYAFDKGECGWTDEAERGTGGETIKWDEIDWSDF